MKPRLGSFACIPAAKDCREEQTRGGDDYILHTTDHAIYAILSSIPSFYAVYVGLSIWRVGRRDPACGLWRWLAEVRLATEVVIAGGRVRLFGRCGLYWRGAKTGPRVMELGRMTRPQNISDKTRRS